MKNLTVNYRGVILEVEGEHTKGEEADYEYPGSPDEFEIETVCAGSKINIYDILETSQIYELEKICIAKINEQN
tara:strand:+ start:657 stop:878 length:222 start_codon:yes stop_codon:yes gene_type:complete